MRRFFRTGPPPDRRAARLLARRAIADCVHTGGALAAVPRSSAGVAALTRAIRTYGADALCAPRSLDESDAARAMRAACALLAREARTVDPVRAERLLRTLKTLWPTLPEIQALLPGAPRDGLWSRVVTVCVEEFYAPPVIVAASEATHTMTHSAA